MNEEFACIRKVARDFPYVSMDTEFPGVVAKPTGTFRNNSDYQCAAPALRSLLLATESLACLHERAASLLTFCTGTSV
jgi:hypothetical protein